MQSRIAANLGIAGGAFGAVDAGYLRGGLAAGPGATRTNAKVHFREGGMRAISPFGGDMAPRAGRMTSTSGGGGTGEGRRWSFVANVPTAAELAASVTGGVPASGVSASGGIFSLRRGDSFVVLGEVLGLTDTPKAERVVVVQGEVLGGVSLGYWAGEVCA